MRVCATGAVIWSVAFQTAWDGHGAFPFKWEAKFSGCIGLRKVAATRGGVGAIVGIDCLFSRDDSAPVYHL